MSSTTMRQQCPRTGIWFDAKTAPTLYNVKTSEPLSRMTFPVMIRGVYDQVYELSDIVSEYVSNSSKDDQKIYQLSNLEPVRYPGFKNYATTKELLRLITGNDWQE